MLVDIDAAERAKGLLVDAHSPRPHNVVANRRERRRLEAGMARPRAAVPGGREAKRRERKAERQRRRAARR